MLSKKDLAKLIKHLKKDKVLRTQTFLASNKLSADSVIESDGGTLLHLVCKMAAENVFWAVRRGARPNSYLVKDKHGRTPCHYAAINLIKTSKMSVFQNIIQPMIEDCVDCLHVPDKDGRTPLQVLSAHSVCASMLRAQLSSVPAAGRVPDSWHDKIWAEMQYEGDRFDRYDKDFSEYLSDDAEDMSSWSERMRSEHSARERSSPAQPSPAEKRRKRKEREEQARERVRAEDAERADRRRRQEEEQERARRFREAEEERGREGEARRQAREEARQRLGQTPKGASAKLSKVVRRYRALQQLVHSEDGPLVLADFKPLGSITQQETRRLVESGAENPSERRRAVRDMLRLWHPDKCMAKIDRRMKRDNDKVKALVVSFVQLLNQLL